MSGYAIAETIRAGRETGRVRMQSGVNRRQLAYRLVSAPALWRRFVSARVQFFKGLKIRVSAVRFCPWPFDSRTTTYAVLTRLRRAMGLGDSLGDLAPRGRGAFGDPRPDVWQSRAVFDTRLF
jgi:hypothetical protein